MAGQGTRKRTGASTRSTRAGAPRRKPPGRRRAGRAETFPPAVLVLSGGAPNGALIAGALATIYKRGKTFSTLYTSGAGALMGMIFKAPKPPLEAHQALALLLDMGVEDSIYSLFPVGYKTFFKSGPFTNLWLKMAEAFKLPATGASAAKRTYNDLVDFCFALTCPTTVSYMSKGLCAHPPFMKKFVDFSQLNNRSTPGQFFMNAYCIETAAMEEFNRANQMLTEAHFNAALSYPFIYPPTRVNDKHYFEGGCVDPLNLTALADHIEAGDILARTVVLMDILGPLKKMLVRVPENLWDAYGISIMLPVVALAEKNEALFNERIKDFNAKQPARQQVKVKKIEFEIKDEDGPDLADWSRSNMTRCWKYGEKAATAYLAIKENYDELPDHGQGTSEPTARSATPPETLGSAILGSIEQTVDSLGNLVTR